MKNKNVTLIYKMSLQSIIDSHANAMVARHNQVESLIQDQASLRARDINERTEALADAFDKTGSALGSAAGAYHLGRGVYKAYKAKGLKGAAKELADKAREAKGDLKNIKPSDDAPTGDAPTGAAPTGPTGTATDDPQAVSDRLDGLLRDAQAQKSQPTVPNEEANDDPSAPESGSGNPTETADISSGSNEASVVNPGSEADVGSDLGYKVGTVDEPEGLQVARWSDMAEKVAARNASKGLDIEGNPLREGLKPGERVLADVTKPGKATLSQPQPQGGDVEQGSVPEPAPGPTADDPLPTTETSGKLFKDAPAPSDDAPASDQPLNADSSASPNIESSAVDDAAKSAANESENMASKIGSKASTAIQNTGSDLTENISSKVGKGAGSLLEDTLPETLESVGSALDFIPVVGEIAGVGLGLAGLFESIFGKHSDESDQQKLIPTAPSASGIDPKTIARVNLQSA